LFRVREGPSPRSPRANVNGKNRGWDKRGCTKRELGKKGARKNPERTKGRRGNRPVAPAEMGPSGSVIAGHDEEGLGFEALVVGAQPVTIIIFLYVYDLLNTGNHVDGDVVIPAISQAHQSALRMVQNQI